MGHAGLVIAAYNRVNATGISRVTIKRVEKLIVLLGALIPLAFLYLEWPTISEHGLAGLAHLHVTTFSYLVVTAVFSLVAIPAWILARPCFTQDTSRFSILETEVFKPSSHKQTGSPTNPADLNFANQSVPRSNCFDGKKFAKMGELPRNEISWTEANRKRLILDNLPEALVGLRIAHISDIHFTGQMSNAYYDRAIQWINSQAPDLIIIAGDIVDYAHALDRIEEVLGRLEAREGKFFVLGNHDRRLENPLEVCERLEKLQWIDLGKANHTKLLRGEPIEFLGNERPWFVRHAPPQGCDNNYRETEFRLGNTLHSQSNVGPCKIPTWKMGVAHSPDQFHWGVQNGCGLLLCGHTHGGQIRFPWAGPLIAPSWHGSKFASGVFYRQGTVMHVSRGLSGVHPFRWGCPPEISILELAR